MSGSVCLNAAEKVVVLNILCTKFKTPVFLHVNVQNWKQLSKYGSLDRLIVHYVAHRYPYASCFQLLYNFSDEDNKTAVTKPAVIMCLAIQHILNLSLLYYF